MQEVFRCLSGLPVPVLERVLQRGGDLGAVEGGEGEDGAAADGGLVVAGGEDRGEAGGVGEGAEGGDGRLPGETVLVNGRDPGQRTGGAGAWALGELGGPAAHGRSGIGEGGPPGRPGRRRTGTTDQGTQGRGPNPGVRIGPGPLLQLPHGTPWESTPHAQAGGVRGSFEGGVGHGTATLRRAGRMALWELP